MKKILINALILDEKNTGLGVYTKQIISHVCPSLIAEGISVEILCKKASYLPESLRNLALELNVGGFLSRLIIPEKLNLNGYDLIWSTTQHGMLRCRSKQIITIHDVTPLLYPEGRIHQYLYYKIIIPYILRKCRGVVAVSDNTARDIERYYPSVKRRKIIRVIKESIQDSSKAGGNRKLPRWINQNCPYFVVTGIHYKYKNIDLIIDAMRRYADLRRFKVFIVGDNENSYGEHLKRKTERESLQNNVIFTGYVSDEDRDSLLSRATAVIFPSKYEGFGLPLLEAMREDIPVICSNASSFPEVAGDAAVYFDPDSTQELRNGMLRLANDEEFRSRMIERGKMNLKRFDWNSIADRMKKYIEESM